MTKPTVKARITALIAAGAVLYMLAGVACDDSPPEGEPTTGPTGPGSGGSGQGGSGGSGGSGGQPDCFTNPTTHDELINACTDAEFVDKTPNIGHPMWDPKGALPELP